MRKGNRSRITIGVVAVSVLAGLVPLTLAAAAIRADSGTPPGGSAPSTPPAQVCGNANLLSGPATPPQGSVRIDPGQDLNAATQAAPAGTTFWLAPGTHTLGNDQYNQVIPKDNDTYVGAPGAALDGRSVNRFAFTQQASNVTIKYLTIQNFGPAGANNNEGVVNHDSGSGWQVDHNTIRANAGAGLFVGSNNVVRYNCLADNGQYGFSMYKPQLGSLNTITIDHNEVAGNNTYDWEAKIPGCGCSGGGKFWDAHAVTVTANWVHDNKGVGLWADTNNYGFLFDGNYIAGNDAEGIFFELSYNSRITNNTLVNNAIVKGKAFANRNDSFPIAAIYVSESGGDTRVNGGVDATLDISGNTLTNNWGGVVLWENADRFCGNGFSTAYCTLVNPATANLNTCTSANINAEPYYSDCRWKTANVNVSNNLLTFHRADVGCTTGACGQQALLANYGSYPSWSPYKGRVVQDAITFHQNNHFTKNSYVGDWVFTPFETATNATFSQWQSAPYSQDAGSTSTAVPPQTTTTTSAAPTTTVPAPTTTTLPAPTTTVPAPATTLPAPTTTLPAPTTTTPAPTVFNLLDSSLAGLEGGIGAWVPWYSAYISRSDSQAHSGTHSLRVDVLSPWGWGVQLNVWPGLPVVPGNKTISFWGLSGSGPGFNATMQVTWLDLLGNPLRTDMVTIPSLTSTWQQASLSTTPPAGTALMTLHLVGNTASYGPSLYFDDFSIVSG